MKTNRPFQSVHSDIDSFPSSIRDVLLKLVPLGEEINELTADTANDRLLAINNSLNSVEDQYSADTPKHSRSIIVHNALDELRHRILEKAA